MITTKLNESSIINALHARKLNEEEAKNPAGTSDEPRLWMMDDFLNVCPECGEYFTSPDDIDGEEIECPNCHAIITNECVGAIESCKESELPDDAEDDDELIDTADCEEASDKEPMNEVTIKVSGGKVLRFKKPAKKGFKRVGGKYVKMTAAEKKARKMAGKKMGRKGLGNKGSAKMKRRKSMKKRSNISASYHINEAATLSCLNTSVNEAFKANPTYMPFKAVSIDEAIYDEGNDVLRLNTSIQYEDGNMDEAQFVLTDVSEGTFTLTESTGVFDLPNVRIEGDSFFDEDSIVIQ